MSKDLDKTLFDFDKLVEEGYVDVMGFEDPVDAEDLSFLKKKRGKK